MKRLPLLLAALVVALAVGIVVHSARRHGLLPQTISDPATVVVPPDELLKATDFRFTFGDGSGLYGYNVVKIQPDNTCQYTFLGPTAGNNRQQWRRAEFPLPRQTVDALRRILNETDFFNLKREYHSGAVDGTQRFVKVQAMGRKKSAYCDNYFPAQIERIRGFVEQQILATHRRQISNAAIITYGPKDAEPEGF